MNQNQTVYEKKELFVEEFQVFDSMVFLDMENNFDKKIIEQIEQSEGVYIYRSQLHEPHDSGFIKWLRTQTDLLFYSKVIVTFRNHNEKEEILPRNNELVTYLKFNIINRRGFLDNFKISILDIRNTLSKKTLYELENNSFYTGDGLYDQYDFVFTIGDKVCLLTDIHSFQFLFGI